MKMSDTNARAWRDILIKTVSIASMVAMVLWLFGRPLWYARDAEGELVTLAKSIAIGDRRSAVIERFSRGSYAHLTFYGEPQDSAWHFNTPFRIGAQNWILIVRFENDRVVSIRFATADQPDRGPEGAPPDRVEQR